MIDRRFALVVALTLGLLFGSSSTEAQSAGRTYRIGWLAPAANPDNLAAFRSGLRTLGARNPVLYCHRIRAPAAGPEPGRQAQGVTHFPSARRAMIRALSEDPAAAPDPCAVPVPSFASPR